MNNLVGDWIGVVHLGGSILAMLFGATVLLTPKGTRGHKIWGYCYSLSMFTVLVTALFIYRLFGTFGPFHVIAVIGFGYLVVGLLPAMLRFNHWLKFHVYSMYWSVVGIYAAFFAEVAVRIPKSDFWWMVILGTILVTVVGGIAYGKYKDAWLSFSNTSPPTA